MDDLIKGSVIFTGCVGIFFTAILLNLISPVISAGLAYFGITFIIWLWPFAGEVIVTGLHGLGVKEVALATLPSIAAALAFVGAYFRSSNKNECKK